jgi:hypothetical protein
MAEQRGGLAQALVVAGLLRHVGEEMPQVGVGVAEPFGLGGETEHGPHHGERDQFGVAQLRADPHGRSPRCEMG